MAPIKDGVLGGGGNPIRAFSPPCSTIVVMKTSSKYATSLLEHASFRKTTFHPNYLKSPEKNTCIT
jgi:hypothetical protein